MKKEYKKLSSDVLDRYRQALHELNKRMSYKEIAQDLEEDYEYIRNFVRGKTGKSRQTARVQKIINFIDQLGGLDSLLNNVDADEFDSYGVVDEIKDLSHKKTGFVVDPGGFYIGISRNYITNNPQFLLMCLGYKKGYLSYALHYLDPKIDKKKKIAGFITRESRGLAYAVENKIFFIGPFERIATEQRGFCRSHLFQLIFNLNKTKTSFYLTGFTDNIDVLNRMESIGFLRMSNKSSNWTNVDLRFDDIEKLDNGGILHSFYQLLKWQPKKDDPDPFTSAIKEFDLRKFDMSVDITEIAKFVERHPPILLSP